MSRSKRTPERAARLEGLHERGDWRALRAEARALLADPAAGEVERAAAGLAMARLRPEPVAMAVGTAGLALLVAAVGFGLLLR
ncbi:MAG TPA: hypothetical protein VFR85_04355 [Anaeromyxobacteraceae bacterium]|nr:hypothetical protein [Anaeromyxobacteraceae bacterium]